jgi:hypothetical protein
MVSVARWRTFCWPLEEGAQATVPSPSALGGRPPGLFNCLSVASCLSPIGREKEKERALARWRPEGGRSKVERINLRMEQSSSSK